MPVPTSRPAAYVLGTFDTKGTELRYLVDRLREQGIDTRAVDVSTSGQPSGASVTPGEVAAHHPEGAGAVFTGDRGSSIRAMALALERYLLQQRDIAGVVAAGGSGGTALIAPSLHALPVGLPKVLVSTVAAGAAASSFSGATDVCMMYSVTDIAGINRISSRVLANAANALAGMIKFQKPASSEAKPAVGVTMFGVTTPCVNELVSRLSARFDCLVFHATGLGGQSMEKLADSGLLAGVLDVTTTEVADKLVGGIFPASDDRFGAIIRTGLPYVGSCGALDMVNFGAIATVPERFKARQLYQHNPQITLMRTDADENRRMGEWIAARLNQMSGPTRFILPLRGVSSMDRPGAPFHDPKADAALFEALRANVRQTTQRRLIEIDCAINEPEFAAAAADHFQQAVS